MSGIVCKVLGHDWVAIKPGNTGPALCRRCGARRKVRTNFRDRMEHKGRIDNASASSSPYNQLPSNTYTGRGYNG